jgi:transposase InsO family protein
MTAWRPDIPLPAHWPEHAKTALLHAAALAHFALTHIHGWCMSSPIERVKLQGQVDRAQAEFALLREQLRIKDARMVRIPPAHRPHYLPTERLAILQLKAARGWNQAHTARAFLVAESTIASWLRRLEEQGHHALVQTPGPVNKYPHFVSQLVQQLKATLPAMGKVRVASMLARAGLHLSATTVKRMLERPLSGHPPHHRCADTTGQESTEASHGQSCEMLTSNPANDQSGPARASQPRRVIAHYPNHVWSVDQTAVPICGGLWAPWLGWALPQCWPFCFWLSVLVDHCSRRVLAVTVYPSVPTAQQVCALLEHAVRQAGRAPKYTVTDQGSQFQGAYRDWCDQHGVRPRFGALYKHGSIALVERVVLTIKNECTRRILVPFGLQAMRREVALFAHWYNEFRPHASLGGCTPDEVYRARKAARDGPRFEPRLLYPTSCVASRATGSSCRSTTSRAGGICRLSGCSVLPERCAVLSW